MLWLILLISSASAQIDRSKISMENWTTCEEFMRNYTHNISRIVDIDWKIFYSWDAVQQDSYKVWFSRPSKEMVDRYRVQLEKELKDINFNDAELFMDSQITLTALFIKTNVSGIYRIVPQTAFQVPYIPKMHIALKVVDPGYLGVMNCGLQYCHAMAPIDKMPPDDKLEEAASKLSFWNSLGRSYLTMTTAAPPPTTTPYDDDDDIDEHFVRDYNRV